MKKFLSGLVFVLFLLIQSNVLAQTTSSNTEKNEKKILELVLKNLNEEHISPKKLDDEFSKKLFNSYLNSLDVYKVFFIQSDIEEFKKYETKLDDQLKANDQSFFDLAYDRFLIRMIEGREIYSNILINKLDFTQNDVAKVSFNYIETNNKLLVFPKKKEDQILNWKIALKTLVCNQSVADYFNNNPNKLSFKENFNKNLENLSIFLESSLFNYVNITRERVFIEKFINTITTEFDSNSEFFSKVKYVKYLNKINNGSTTNGLFYAQGKDFVEIKRITKGSTADLSGKIEIGDAVLKIQKEGENLTNVTSFNIFEVADMTKTAAGKLVKFTLKKPNGTIYDVSLKNTFIFSDDIYIKTAIIQKDKLNFGVIGFSDFYKSVNSDEEKKDSQADFVNALEILNRENAEGLILDLRNNSGSSARLAVDILSNFLTNAKVAQLKKQKAIEVLQTISTEKNWAKNIVVIVNHKSSSSVELIVKALQDYNAAVVIGELTNGKSSIEEFIFHNSGGLDKKENANLGVLSIASQKFYNLNGKSVQRKGVQPDVVFNINDKLDREATYLRSLPADEVKPIIFKPINKLGYFATVIKASQTRLSKSENFKRFSAKIQEDLNFDNNLKQIKTLNFAKLNTELETLISGEKTIEDPVFDKNREFIIPAESLAILKDQEFLIKKRKEWLESLKTDIQIDEGINILQDMLYMPK